MTPTLTSLLSRVREATGRLDDETLAHLIARLQGKEAKSWQIVCGDDGSDELDIHFTDGSWPFQAYRERCPDVSIDAAVALVERVLPGCDWKISTLRHRKGFGAGLYPSAADAVARADAATAPLAILAALLSALEQKESTG